MFFYGFVIGAMTTNLFCVFYLAVSTKEERIRRRILKELERERDSH